MYVPKPSRPSASYFPSTTIGSINVERGPGNAGNLGASTYVGYNYANKITDMDYLRVRGTLFGGLKIDDEAYTYAYVNKTVTTTLITQTLANIAAGTWGGSKSYDGKGTYAFDDNVLGGYLDGVSIFMNGSWNFARTGGYTVSQAPLWTSTGGIVYKHDGFKVSIIDKLTGQQYLDSKQTTFYKLGAYNAMDAKIGYDFGQASLEFSVNNVLDSRSLVSVKGSDGIGGTSVRDWKNRPSSLDQYYFQPSRSLMVSLKLHS